MRIILVRHGRPHLPDEGRVCHRTFGRYIDSYEQAGLDPASAPPQELQDLVQGVSAVLTSGKPRAAESARRLLPDAELVTDPLFVEAPLPSPPFPVLRLKVPAWAIISRILWHAGYHPEIENWKDARARSQRAASILEEKAAANGDVVLVAHGYFNAMIGWILRNRGWTRTGTHRAQFWNCVVYSKAHVSDAAPVSEPAQESFSPQAANG